jgi:hypothetical protein
LLLRNGFSRHDAFFGAGRAQHVCNFMVALPDGIDKRCACLQRQPYNFCDMCLWRTAESVGDVDMGGGSQQQTRRRLVALGRSEVLRARVRKSASA